MKTIEIRNVQLEALGCGLWKIYVRTVDYVLYTLITGNQVILKDWGSADTRLDAASIVLRANGIDHDNVEFTEL